MTMDKDSLQVDIDIQEDLDVSQRDWLIAKLEQEAGIVSALFVKTDPPRLRLCFKPDHFSHETLLDALKLQGCHGKISRETE